MFPAVAPIRAASRQMVRELGMLDGEVGNLNISCAQGHALMEIEAQGSLTPGELAERLNLDPSTVSRTVAKLLASDLISAAESEDRRSKSLILTQGGRKTLDSLHKMADAQVAEALALLEDKDRQAVTSGLELYARALAKARRQREFEIRPIRPEDDPAVARIIRATLESYGMTMGGSAIWDPEVDNMSANYTVPGSAYYVVERAGKLVGGAGYGPLDGSDHSIAELRKMYFLPEARGCGMGRKLLALVLEAATQAGYKEIYCETIKRMSEARGLYESFGFKLLDSPMGCTGHTACEVWYWREMG